MIIVPFYIPIWALIFLFHESIIRHHQRKCLPLRLSKLFPLKSILPCKAHWFPSSCAPVATGSVNSYLSCYTLENYTYLQNCKIFNRQLRPIWCLFTFRSLRDVPASEGSMCERKCIYMIMYHQYVQIITMHALVGRVSIVRRLNSQTTWQSNTFA